MEFKMDERGRRVTSVKSGEQHPNVKISDSLVCKIFEEYDKKHGSQKKLSIKYGIPTSTINRIINNKGRFKNKIDKT